ncbi:MAG: prepilin-type N-terminal cleavage/methylation domain-containing protein [Pseudomonadota bacterium]
MSHPRSDPTDAGFTLIELVAVVAVVAVLAVGVGLMAARPGAGRPDADLRIFERMAETLSAQAVRGRQAHGLFVTSEGLRRAAMTTEGWAVGKPILWRGGVVLRLRTQRRGPDSPHIIFLPNGETTAFTLSFDASDGRGPQCQSDGVTGVSCNRG